MKPPNPDDVKKEAGAFIGNVLKTLKDLANPEKLLQLAKGLAGDVVDAAQKANAQPAGGGAGFNTSPRAMRYPYTHTAKIVQFPWVYYYRNNWIYRYYFIAIVACFPIFVKLSGVFNSETNKRKWAALQEKARLEDEQHQPH